MSKLIQKSRDSRGSEATSDLTDAIRKSNIILANKSRFSTNVIERAIVFLSLNDESFDLSIV